MDNNSKCTWSGILEKGYGIYPRIVAMDSSLTIESKAIYAMICSFAGSDMPSVTEQCTYLNISDERYKKHMDLLIKSSYVTLDDGIYTLISKVKDTGITMQPVSPSGRDAMFKVEVLKERLGDISYNTWIASHRYIEFDEYVQVICMNSFMAGQVEKKYKNYINEVFPGKRIDVINESGPGF